MISRPAVAIALIAGLSLGASAQAAELRYRGTVGQRHVIFRLDIDDETLRTGLYRYDGQTGDVRLVDTRVFGTTAVLQDEDGNTFHLHFQGTDGAGVPTWSAAAVLEGTVERGELDLPVRLLREEPRGR